MKDKTTSLNNKVANALDELVALAISQPNPAFKDLVLTAGLNPSTDFRNASLVNIDFRDEDLRGFNFSGADLTGADFRRANVQGVSFDKSILIGAIGLAAETPEEVEFDRPLSATQIVKNKIIAGIPVEESVARAVKVLKFGNTGINTIRGIERLYNLQKLSIRNTNVRDLGPVSDLISLKEIYLDGSKVDDLSPLCKLRGLRRLSARNIPLKDLSPIGLIEGLEDLDVRSQFVSNWDALTNLKNLKSLNINTHRNFDASVLVNSRLINSLSIVARKIIRANAIGYLRDIKRLYISSESEEIDFLSELLNIQSLHLRKMSVSSLPKYLPELTFLSIKCSANFDADSVGNHWNIGYLQLINPKIEILQKLANKNLTSVHLEGSIVDENFLAYIPDDIETLSLENASIVDISELARLKGLRYLSLAGSKVRDVRPLLQLDSLSSIDLEGTRAENQQLLIDKNQSNVVLRNGTTHYSIFARTTSP